MGFWDERREKREARQAEKAREREEFEAKIRQQVAEQEAARKRKAAELEAEQKRLLELAEREKEEKRARKRDARIQAGMQGSRATFREKMNVLLKRGPAVDEDFWEGLEEVLIMSDMGVDASVSIVAGLRETATRQALPDAYAVYELLASQIAANFPKAERDPFADTPSLVLFVGINGAGKTTTVGKIAYEGVQAGRSVILGSADTFRAAAIEQLEVWGQRAGVEIVQRERGADPASVCYDTIERAEALGVEEVLIDTAGRLHTSDDLMRELAKVVKVVRKRSQMPVTTVLVIDATTGQNGLQQAREFHRSLELDGIIVTKLDGTAKGGIAVAIAHDLKLPIYKIGVGETIEDLKDFDAEEFANSLIGSPEDLEGGSKPKSEAEADGGARDKNDDEAGSGEDQNDSARDDDVDVKQDGDDDVDVEDDDDDDDTPKGKHAAIAGAEELDSEDDRLASAKHAAADNEEDGSKPAADLSSAKHAAPSDSSSQSDSGEPINKGKHAR